jgi:putative transposase
MDEYEKRKVAITRHSGGEKITSIVKSLGKTRQWFYFWLKRYQESKDEDSWFIEESRAPKTHPSKIPNSLESLIIKVRQDLEDEHYSQKGAIAIQYKFRELDLEPPSIWTINRVIARNGLNNKESRIKSPKEYPELFLSTQQMDLVGPRYIHGDGRFFSLNIIDTQSHTCFTKPIRSKCTDQVVPAVAEFWSSFGLPDALQMDNELSFRGSNRHPRSFGKLVRFALNQGVVPVYIPIREPWRNGMIEKFNDNYTQRFLRKTKFNDFNDLCHKAKCFNEFHNSHHRYSSQNQKTPIEASQYSFSSKYTGDIHNSQKIPLETGSIMFIRFIRSNLKLNIMNEEFKLDDSLRYSYVVAKVSIDKQTLTVFQNREIHHVFNYKTEIDW